MGQDDPSELVRRIEELTARLAEVEQVLGISRAEPVLPPPMPAEPPPFPVDREVGQVPAWAPPFAAVAAAASAAEAPTPATPTTPATSPPRSPAAPLVVPDDPAFAHPPGRVPIAMREPFSLERLIGGKFFLAIGAIVVVIGVGLFLKLAYDMGWLRLSPAAKCLAGSAFGAVLLALGEVARRRINAWASAGLSATGLGSLFASVYAAYGFYGLLGAPVAFILLAGCALLGIGIGARARIVAVSVLSLAAGYLVPFILDVETADPAVLPGYLLMLLGVGLGLSAWRGGAFVALRTVSWWATNLIGLVWIFPVGGAEYPYLVGAFLAVFWLAVHGELWTSARRSSAAYEPLDVRKPVRWSALRHVVTSFGTTVYVASVGTLVLRISPVAPEWVAAAGGVVATGALWLVLAGHLRVLVEAPRNELERLGAGLAVQAGGLLIAAVALGVVGWMEAVAWLGLGLASVAGGRWIGSRGLNIYGVVVLSIAAVRLIVWDSWYAGLAAPEAVVIGFALSRWMLLMVIGATAWLGAGVLMLPAPLRWRAMPIGCIAISFVLAWASLLHEAAALTSKAAATVLLPLLVMAAATKLRSHALVIMARAWLLLGGGFVAAAHRELNQFGLLTAGGLVFTNWTWLMLLAASVWGVLAWDARRWPAGAVLRRVGAGLVVALVFLALLDERAKASWICWVWIGLAVGVSLLHRAIRTASLDWYGLAGVGLSVVAWSVAFVGPGWDASRAAPLLHPGMLTALAIVGAAAWIARGLRAPGPYGPQRTLLIQHLVGAACVVLVFAASSLETTRAAEVWSKDPTTQGAALSIWWGVFAVALIAVGFRRRIPIARHSGLALLLIATGKAVVFDLAEVPAVWRVASFLGLGLLMLGVAVVYAKVSAMLARPGGFTTEAPRH